jgi:hypothetical protein
MDLLVPRDWSVKLVRLDTLVLSDLSDKRVTNPQYPSLAQLALKVSEESLADVVTLDRRALRVTVD